MSNLVGGLFNFSDRLQMESLNQRMNRNNVISSNIANAETPGYLSLGYDFEEQLQAASNANEPIAMKTSNGKHLRNQFTQADNTMSPEVFVKPTESIPQDGNTVDVNTEMAEMAQNQISYRAAVELLNKKVGLLRYAITTGGR